LKTPRFYRYNISRIQPRGVLAERLKEILKRISNPEIQLSYLILLFRDDFRRTDKPLEANKTKLILSLKIKSSL
jgi:pyrimidine operon attenuation protein/uracil phosphoribosyltransferase